MTSVTYTATKGLKLLGDEKGAWLADTAEETITGYELVTNSGFSTDISNWSSQNDSTIAWVSPGHIEITRQTLEANAYQLIPTDVGKVYQMSALIASGGSVSTGTLSASTTPGSSGNIATASGNTPGDILQVTFTATSTSTYIRITNDSSTANDTIRWDWARCRLADQDLSANNNGLGVYGSITKSAVATGSGLVAYSGFSASNYLEQPYNADLDFGTGDFCVMGWVKPNGVSGTYDAFIELGGPSSINEYAGNGFYISTGQDAAAWRVSTHVGNTSSLLEAGAWQVDEWNFVAMVRSGGNLYSYLNGSLSASKVSTQDITLSGTETLMIGRRHSTSNPNPSAASQAMFRVLNYSLTAAQIKAIYDSEKHLFKKNRMYTQVGEEYSLDFDSVSVLTRGGNTVGKARLSIDGTREFLKQRDEVIWDVTTGIVDRANFDPTRRFLESVSGGAQFTFDPYGTIASPDEPRTCTLESNSHQEQTTGPRHISTSFKVRES